MKNYTSNHSIAIAINFLELFFRKENFRERILSFAGNFPINLELFLAEKAEVLDLVAVMEHAAKTELADWMADIRYYFDHPDEAGKCEALYSFVLLRSMVDTYPFQNLQDLSQDLEKLSESEYSKAFGNILFSYNNSVIKEEPEVPDFALPISVASFILDMEIPTEVKWKLQDIYLHPEIHRRKLLSLLEQTMHFIRKFETKIDEQVEKFYSYWSVKRGDRDYYQFLTEELPMLAGMPRCPLGYALYPCLFFHMISFSMPTDETGEPTAPAAITLGMIYGDALSLQTVLQGQTLAMNDGKCMEALKLLSDKSRFAILKYISDKEAYSSQIAKHLGLTTATVSHHMNALYEAGLVTVEKRQARLYYALSKEMLIKYIDYWEQHLLT